MLLISLVIYAAPVQIFDSEETSMQQTLMKYDEMCKLIAECHAIDEVREIQNKAVAVTEYHRRAKNFEAERQARVIRLRATRRLGELLIEMEENGQLRNRGGNGSNQHEQKLSGETFALTLEELGVPRHEAAQSKELARIPPETFEELVIVAQLGEVPITATYIISMFHPPEPPRDEPPPLSREDEPTMGSPEWIEEQWKGMPPFHQEDQMQWKTLYVHFKCQEDMEAFSKLVGQKIGLKTRYIWYPKAEILKVAHMAWVSKDPEVPNPDETFMEMIDEDSDEDSATPAA